MAKHGMFRLPAGISRRPGGGRAPRPAPMMSAASFTFEEGKDDRDGLFGLFLHDPVTGIGNDGATHIGRGEPDLSRQTGTIGMIAADREHRAGPL